MTNTISNIDDVIDSRDIIKRIEVLTDQCEASYLDFDEYQELCTLSDLAEEGEQYASDWSYGEQLIQRAYFKQAMDDMVADCYEMPKDMPFWMSIELDYDALEQDYTSLDFDGIEYLIRSV